MFLLFGTEPLPHIQHVMRKLDLFGLLLVGQAMGYPSRGEEAPKVVQISENHRPWPVDCPTDIAGEE
jgi:hypothetical protein